MSRLLCGCALMLKPNTRAVVFDAGGTLIFPYPPAAQLYAEVGRRHGSRLTAAEIGPRFAAAFARQEAVDQQFGFRTDEWREEERWRRIVAEVLDDLTDFEGCFAELFHHYSLPEAWRCPDEAAEVLEALHAGGRRLALASNYDRRLHSVRKGLPALRLIEHVVISADVGWRKPAPEFFAAVCRAVGCAAADILFVGDDLANDYEGARAAGMRAALYDPRGVFTDVPRRITRFRQLLDAGRAPPHAEGA